MELMRGYQGRPGAQVQGDDEAAAVDAQRHRETERERERERERKRERQP